MRPAYAFNFRLELLDGSGDLISYYEDRTLKPLTDTSNSRATVGDMLDAAHGKWNIPESDVVINGVYQTVVSDFTTIDGQTFPIVKSYEVNQGADTTFIDLFDKPTGSKIKVMFDPTSSALTYTQSLWRLTIDVKNVYFGIVAYSVTAGIIEYDFTDFSASRFFASGSVTFNSDLPWTQVNTNDASGNVLEIGYFNYLIFEILEDNIKIQMWSITGVMIAEWPRIRVNSDI